MKLSKEFQTIEEAAAEWAADEHAQVSKEIADASARNRAEYESSFGGLFSGVYDEEDYDDDDLICTYDPAVIESNYKAIMAW